ncbi:hypothetical protein [Cellulomonas denverensis]|uniref:hypothetical protein n=1 Tax=Cellulomonas denverensis TaxID=264297 RepID=UPI0035F0B1FE
MASPLSPAIMLATSMHAQPGTYAALLGSGVSRGAGLPTGWDIVTTLVGKVAAQMTTDEADHVTAASDDPEAWWLEQFGTTLGYSSLLGELAPAPATRQGILEGFFERPPRATTTPTRRPSSHPGRTRRSPSSRSAARSG